MILWTDKFHTRRLEGIINTDNHKNNYMLQYIVGLKGLLTIIILILHIIICFYPATYYGIDGQIAECGYRYNWELFVGRTPLLFFYNGSFAVYIFFIVSGFLLTKSIYKSQKVLYDLKKLILRIEFFCITIFLSILFSYAVIFWGFNHNYEVGYLIGNGALYGYLYPKDAGSFLSIFKDLFDVFRGWSIYNVPLWFMSCEIVGTLYTYCFCIIRKKTKTKAIFALMILVSLVTSIVFRKQYIICFLAGILFNEFGKINEKKESRLISNSVFKNVFILFLIFLGILFGGYPIIKSNDRLFYECFPNIPYEYYYVMGSICIFYAIMYSYIIQKLLNNKILGKIGEISYYVYLFHFPVYMSLGMYLFLNLNENLKIQYDIAAFISGFISILFSLCIALLFNSTLGQIIKKQTLLRKAIKLDKV